MSRILRTWSERGLEFGTYKWDPIIMRALSILLAVATHCPNGKIGRSMCFTGNQFIAWYNLVIKYDGQAPSVADLTITTIVRNERGAKYVWAPTLPV